ncbi:hypothetical protein [Limosilactobacillus caccae]|uniref:hypothetical protein n=1 Tax=Limosilactobacillus caccae TaxID=1926284 RepID=UPI000970B998|nr:hypothetical protein [Limosilactobacillus caccae]
MDQLLTFIFTIIFLLESFWEVRLFSQLQQLAINNPAKVTPKFTRVMQHERRWNWLSWILIILLFVANTHFTVLLVSLITLIETVVIYQMDQLKSQLM